MLFIQARILNFRNCSIDPRTQSWHSLTTDGSGDGGASLALPANRKKHKIDNGLAVEYLHQARHTTWLHDPHLIYLKRTCTAPICECVYVYTSMQANDILTCQSFIDEYCFYAYIMYFRFMPDLFCSHRWYYASQGHNMQNSIHFCLYNTQFLSTWLDIWHFTKHSKMYFRYSRKRWTQK